MAKNRDFKVHTEGAPTVCTLKSQYFVHGRLKSRFLREIQENARNPDFMQNHMGRPQGVLGLGALRVRVLRVRIFRIRVSQGEGV